MENHSSVVNRKSDKKKKWNCLNKKKMSPTRLKWKDNTTFSNLKGNNKEPYEANSNAMAVPQLQPSTSMKETLGKELQESSSSTDKPMKM